MTPSNFDWFIHAMLFLSYKICYQRQHNKKQKKEANETEDDDWGLDEESEEEESD